MNSHKIQMYCASDYCRKPFHKDVTDGWTFAPEACPACKTESLKNLSISHATHREQDLIPAFLEKLKELDRERFDRLLRECYFPFRVFNLDDNDPWWTSDAAAYLLNETLFDILDEYSPEGYYFGAHPGDGSDFGYWECEQDDDQESGTFWLQLPEEGVFATVDQDNNIMYCAMLADGSMELDKDGNPDPCLVDCLEGDEQEFLDKINGHFGTDFKVTDIFGQ